MLYPYCTIEYFSETTGIMCGDLFMSFKSIFKDIRAAMDWVHIKVRCRPAGGGGLVVCTNL